MLEVIDGPSSQATTPHNTQHVVSCDLFSLGALSLYVCSLYCYTIQLSQVSFYKSLPDTLHFFPLYLLSSRSSHTYLWLSAPTLTLLCLLFLVKMKYVNRLEHDCIIYQHRVIIKAFEPAGNVMSRRTPPSASLILVYVCFSSYCQVYEYRNVCLLLCGLRAALIV